MKGFQGLCSLRIMLYQEMVKSQRNSQRMLRIFPTTNHKPVTYLGESLTPMKFGIDLTLQTISGKFIGSKSNWIYSIS